MNRAERRRELKLMLKVLPMMMKCSRKWLKAECKRRGFISPVSGKMSAQAMYDGILKELYQK